MITRAQMPRQLRNRGGMTVKTVRQKYGLGSLIKKTIRNLIPNELADIAVKAAPFVAPFNPGAAALMRGVGRFDQRGSISDALKQGAATYAFGKGVGKLGGAQTGDGFFGSQTFSKQGFSEGPIGSMFPKTTTTTTTGFEKSPELSSIKGTTPVTKDETGIIRAITDKTIAKIPGATKLLPKSVMDQLVVGGITSGASALYSYFKGDFRPQEEGETMEEYLAARKETVGKQMRTFMDNYYRFDPEYSAMSDAERDAFVARYNMKKGGIARLGYQAGGVSDDKDFDLTNLRDPFVPLANNNNSQRYFISDLNFDSPQSIIESLLKIDKDIEPFVLQESRYDPFVPGSGGFKTVDPYSKDFNIKEDYFDYFNRIGMMQPNQLSVLYNPKTGELARYNPNLPPLDPDGRPGGYQYLSGERVVKTKEEAMGPPLLESFNPVTDYGTSKALKFQKFLNDPREVRDRSMQTTIEDIDAAVAAGLQEAKPGDAKRLAAATTAPTGIQTIPSDKKVFNVMLDEKGNVADDQSLTQLFRETGTAPQIGIGGSVPIRSMSDVFRLAGITGEDGISMRTDYSGITLPSGGVANTLPPITGGRSLRENVAINEARRRKNQELLAAAKSRLPGMTPIGIMPPSRNAGIRGGFAQPVTLDGQQFTNEADAIKALGIERYNQLMAKGGSAKKIPVRTNSEGVKELDYRKTGGFVPIGVKEKADDVPAMLSLNEFVFTADAVRGAGDGSIKKGAQRMYDTMKKLESKVV